MKTEINDEGRDICFFPIKATHRFLLHIDNTNTLSGIMDRSPSILEAPELQQEEISDEERVRFSNSKILIWDYFGVVQSIYINSLAEEKSKMFKEYYSKLVEKYYGSGKTYFLSWLICLVTFQAFASIFNLIFFWLFFEQVKMYLLKLTAVFLRT